jgi:hypothetical protein
MNMFGVPKYTVNTCPTLFQVQVCLFLLRANNLLLVVHARDDQRVHLALGYVHIDGYTNKLYYSRAKQLVGHLAK